MQNGAPLWPFDPLEAAVAACFRRFGGGTVASACDVRHEPLRRTLLKPWPCAMRRQALSARATALAACSIVTCHEPT